MEPPDPFPNSEVKRLSADGSVVRPCESRSSSAPYLKPPLVGEIGGGFVVSDFNNKKITPHGRELFFIYIIKPFFINN